MELRVAVRVPRRVTLAVRLAEDGGLTEPVAVVQVNEAEEERETEAVQLPVRENVPSKVRLDTVSDSDETAVRVTEVEHDDDGVELEDAVPVCPAEGTPVVVAVVVAVLVMETAVVVVGVHDFVGERDNEGLEDALSVCLSLGTLVHVAVPDRVLVVDPVASRVFVTEAEPERDHVELEDPV